MQRTGTRFTTGVKNSFLKFCDLTQGTLNRQIAGGLVPTTHFKIKAKVTFFTLFNASFSCLGQEGCGADAVRPSAEKEPGNVCHQCQVGAGSAQLQGILLAGQPQEPQPARGRASHTTC